MQILNGAIAALSSFNRGSLACGKFVGWTFLAIMTIVVLVQVFFRYVLANSLAWAEESARYMMVWMAFAVAPAGYRMGMNVSIRTLADMVKGRAQYVLEIGLNLLVMALMATMFTETFGMLKRGMKMSAVSFDLRLVFVYVIVPVSFTLMFLVGVEILLRSVRNIADPDHPLPVFDTASASSEGGAA